MSDRIASFPLRGATKKELSTSLGRSFAEYFAWHGEAMFLSGFAHDARAGGVSTVLTERIRDAMNLAEQFGVLTWTDAKSKTNRAIASDMAEHQLAVADSGVKVAATVILHNACERFIYRLVRFGLVLDRPSAIEWVAERKVSVREIVGHDVEALIDVYLEKWWSDLERESLLKKWDKLIALAGHPPKLEDWVWHFDRDMLSRFDDIRHNAVHHDRQTVKAFDLDEFGKQLERAHFVWVVHIAEKLEVKISAEVLYGLT
jgi:hypothetical protein